MGIPKIHVRIDGSMTKIDNQARSHMEIAREALFATPDVTFRDGLDERSSNPVSTSYNSLWGLSDRLEKGRRPLSRSCCISGLLLIIKLRLLKLSLVRAE